MEKKSTIFPISFSSTKNPIVITSPGLYSLSERKVIIPRSFYAYGPLLSNGLAPDGLNLTIPGIQNSQNEDCTNSSFFWTIPIVERLDWPMKSEPNS